MSELLTCIALTALFVNGLDIATQPGMLLYFIRRSLDKLFISHPVDRPQPVVSKWYYPLLFCIKCMPSVYGTAICLLFLPCTWHLVYTIPVVVICSVALSAIIHSQYL